MQLFDVLVMVGMKDGLVGFTYEIWTYAATSPGAAELDAKVKAEFLTDGSDLFEWRVSEVGEAGQFDSLMQSIGN